MTTTTTLIRPGQAAKQAGIAHSSLRNYTSSELFRRYFSADAAPARGEPRLFSPDDVKLLRFIADQQKQGKTHAEIAGMIDAGGLAAYNWQPPPEPARPAEEEPQQDVALVVLPQMFIAMQDQNRELNQALIEATRALAMAEGRLQAMSQEIERLQAALSDKEELARLHEELAQVQEKRGWLARLLGK